MAVKNEHGRSFIVSRGMGKRSEHRTFDSGGWTRLPPLPLPTTGNGALARVQQFSPSPLDEVEGRSAVHLRAITRLSKTQTVRGSRSLRKKPSVVVDSLASGGQSKNNGSHANSNGLQRTAELDEIWRAADVAVASVKQHGRVQVGNNSRDYSPPKQPSQAQKRIFCRSERRNAGETSKGEVNRGTTLARFRRLVGMTARKSVVAVYTAAARNVALYRLKDKAARRVQRTARSFVARQESQREQLIALMNQAALVLQCAWRQWNAKARSRERRKIVIAEGIKRQSTEMLRGTSARRIQRMYRRYRHQQVCARLAELIAMLWGDWKCRQQVPTNQVSHGADNGSQDAQVKELHASAPDPPNAMVAGQIVSKTPSEESDRNVVPYVAESRVRWLKHDRSKDLDEVMMECAIESEMADTQGSCEGVRKHEDSKTAVLSIETAEVPDKQTDHTHCQHLSSHPIQDSPVSEDNQSAEDAPSAVPLVFKCYEPPQPTLAMSGLGVELNGVTSSSTEPTKETESTKPAIGPSRCATPDILVRFLKRQALPALRMQIRRYHDAARRIQANVRMVQAIKEVSFRRQMRLISLRSELQAFWIGTDARLHADVLSDGIDGAAKEKSRDSDDEVAETEYDDNAVGTRVRWSDLLPTKQGRIPPGLRLNYLSPGSSGHSSALWRWSWSSERWEPEAARFRLHHTDNNTV